MKKFNRYLQFLFITSSFMLFALPSANAGSRDSEYHTDKHLAIQKHHSSNRHASRARHNHRERRQQRHDHYIGYVLHHKTHSHDQLSLGANLILPALLFFSGH